MGEQPGVIIDTDILIKIYRGNKEHKHVLQNLFPNLIISCITQMKLLIGRNNKKTQDEVEENLKSYKILGINTPIISIAHEIIKNFLFHIKYLLLIILLKQLHFFIL